MLIFARFAIFALPGIALSLAALLQTPAKTKPTQHVTRTEDVVPVVKKSTAVGRPNVGHDLSQQDALSLADLNNQEIFGREFDIETENSPNVGDEAEPLIGSNWIVLLGYLFNGSPPIKPEFNSETGKSLTEEGVTVAVVCHAPREVTFDHDAIDYQVAKYTTYRLHEHHIKVVDPDRIRDWLDKHEDWDSPTEIGAAFGVDYVIFIDLNKFSLYEDYSSHLYRGRAEATISVFQMDEDHEEGEKIFSKDILSKYPLLKGRDTQEVTSSQFKRQYQSRLSEEIGRKFYESYAADDEEN